MTQNEKAKPKHTIKDSLFTSIFRDKKYLFELYRTLHPEDTESTEDALTDITIRNILMNGLHNDLGFRVGERVMILVEAQSVWTMNIIIRALFYLAQTYQDHLDGQGADLYSSKKVKLPEPELYVIYTGDRVDRPEEITLSGEFFGGKKCALEVKVKMLYGENGNDIISQYVAFTQIYGRQVKAYGRTKKAVIETIRICRDMGVLEKYLSDREKEVVDIMMTLFDEERLMQIHIANREKEAAKKAAKRAEEQAIEKLLKKGKMSVEEIADCCTEFTAEEIEEMAEKLAQESAIVI